MRLLIINDSDMIVKSLESDINWTELGMKDVFIAYDAVEAKNIITQESIDIILCDIEMPGENGIELIHWIRETNFDIDCILLTCHADFMYAKEALTLDC